MLAFAELVRPGLGFRVGLASCKASIGRVLYISELKVRNNQGFYDQGSTNKGSKGVSCSGFGVLGFLRSSFRMFLIRVLQGFEGFWWVHVTGFGILFRRVPVNLNLPKP